MASLAEILEQQRRLELMITSYIQGLEESEASQSDQEQYLADYCQEWETNSCVLEAKINAYCHATKKLLAEEKYLREQAVYFTNKARSKASKASYLKSRIEEFLLSQPKHKFATLDFNLRMQANKPALQIDDSYDGDIHDNFIAEQKPSDYLDKQIIRAYLMAGGNLPFAKLVQSQSVRGLG